jgi:succinyl-diaminopimelate desuccinylase
MDVLSETAALTASLIARRSLTPADEGCQELIANRLQQAGFTNEHLPFGPVKNLWSRRGSKAPLLVFAGHTDVVPSGPEELWTFRPFEPTVKDGFLYGRGAADMKGGLAAMVTAAERFVAASPQHNGSIAFLLTSDEEGPSTDGTVKVMEHLCARMERIDWCIVGEPSSVNTMGDTIKHGRRGSLTGILTVAGTQGHVAYPQLAKNPIHLAAPAVAELCSIAWDSGNATFPATTLQFSNINSGTGADNVIPSALKAVFNLRFSTEISPEKIKQTVETVLEKHQLSWEIDWRLSGKPFLTAPGELTEAVVASVREITGIESELSTTGGTSDGRFIAPTGAQVVELGVVNATIHKVDECVSISQLDDLSAVYERILTKLLS